LLQSRTGRPTRRCSGLAPAVLVRQGRWQRDRDARAQGRFQRVVKFFLVSPRRSPLKTICYGENHSFVRSTSRDHRRDDSSSLRRHGSHTSNAVREANADSLRRETRHDVRHGQDNNSNSGGVFALHPRRFYTDWRIVRQWHPNSSDERESLVDGWAAGKDLKSDCIQSGIGRFVDRSRNLRLRLAVLRRIESRRCDSPLR